MADILRPGEYGHGNPTKAFVDSSFVRGGGRTTASLVTLLTDFIGKEDQLEDRITLVWVTSENSFYQLKDKLNVGVIGSWSKFKTGSDEVLNNLTTTDKTSLVGAINEVNAKPSGGGGVTYIQQGDNVTVGGIGTETDPYIISAQPGYTDEEAIGAVRSTIYAENGVQVNLDDPSVIYLQGVNAGAGPKGVVRLSVAPLGPDVPIAVGDNDPRVDFDSIITSDVLPAEQTKLSTASNWTAATSTSKEYYSGTGVNALSGNEQGQYYYDGLYFYYFIADDYPIRLGGTVLQGALLAAGTVPKTALDTSTQNQVTEGNKGRLRITMEDVVNPTDWIPFIGKITSAYLIASASEVSTNFNPSATYVYTCETKIAGGTPDSTTLNTTSTTNQFSTNLAAKGTTVDSVTWFRITAPSNIPAGTKLDLFLTINIW